MCGEVIGVIGTIAGTILGWLLNSLSQKGKLKVYTYNWGEYFEMLDGYGGLKPSTSLKESEYYNCHFDVDIYNSSNNPKIMRALKICFCENNNSLFSGTPLNRDTMRVKASVVKYDDIESINIPGKAVKVVHFTYGMNDYNGAFDTLVKSNKVFLTYRDEKDKLKKVLISEHSCYDLFESAKNIQ